MYRCFLLTFNEVKKKPLKYFYPHIDTNDVHVKKKEHVNI